MDHSPARVSLKLTSSCNNDCVFCAQRGADSFALEPQILADELARLRTAGAREVTFVGGEPTLFDDLPQIVAAARAAGFERVGVQTNARRLALPGRAESLAAAGLTDVHVSIHGAAPAVHDYHTGVEGSLAQTLAGVAAARAQKLTVVATTVLTRSNYRVLADLPRMLLARSVAGWTIAVPRVAGAAERGFDRVVPRLGMALPFALHALEGARAVGLPAWVWGAPACLLGPLAPRAIPGDARAYGRPCEQCPSRPHCPGLDAGYLARFGGDEISARRVAPPGDDQPALRRMFVGAGELVHGLAREAVAPLAPEDAPARPARRTLPVAREPRER